MRKYRAYKVDDNGHVVVPATIFEAATDEEALVKAMQWADGSDLEIWDKSRRIGKIEHRGDRRPG